jgi:hypothetical protein
MNKRKYSDEILKYDFSNFSLEFLSDYDEVVFVNKLYFTPKEKEILLGMVEADKRVMVCNQLSQEGHQEDYDEDKLELETITLPVDISPEIEIYEVGEEFLELLTLLSKIEEEEQDYTILDADFENSNYHNILSTERVEADNKFKFTETGIYRFLDSLYNLLVGSSRRGGRLSLKMADLLAATYQQKFRNYYDINEEDLRNLNELARRDYVYFSTEISDEDLVKFNHILSQVERISKFRDIDDFCDFLEEIDLKRLNDERFMDNIDKYYDGLAEIQAITELEIVADWNDYFENRAAGLFSLILNYLKFKKVREITPDAKDKLKIKDLLSSSALNRKNIMLINLSEGRLPSLPTTDFLLTGKQRAELGLETYQQRRLEEKYKFFRHLLSSQRAIIFSIKNEDRNIASSSFVEELRLKYDLEVNELEVGARDYGEMITKVLNSNSRLNHNKRVDFSEQELEITQDDFKNGNLSMTYYKYYILQECYCKFYLRYLAKLEEEKLDLEKTLSLRTLGIVVHDIFETVINNVKGQIKQQNFSIDREVVTEVVNEKIKENRLKIPEYYESYYRDVIFTVIIEAVEDFIFSLRSKISGEIREILSEWRPDRDRTTPFLESDKLYIYLNGRIDLTIRTEDQDYLIDYKTGGGSEEQLDFYSLLFASDMEAGKIIDKSIYDVLKKSFKSNRSDSHLEFRADLKEDLREFIESEEYSKEAGYQCKRCEYHDICRVVLR